MEKHSRIPRTAVLLAAGFGKRQRPATHRIPKPLLRVRHQPLIRYAIDALAYGNIENIYVVTHHLEEQIVEYFNHLKVGTTTIDFCHQQMVQGTADAVRSVARHRDRIARATSYLVISASDYRFPKNYIKALIEFHLTGEQEISISLREIDAQKAKESSCVVADSNGWLEKIIEKPAHVAGERVVAATLLYIVPVGIFNFLETSQVSSRGEYELADVINAMIRAGCRARGLEQAASIEAAFDL